MYTYTLLMHSPNDASMVKPINVIGKSIDKVNEIKKKWEERFPDRMFTIKTVDPKQVLMYLIEMFDTTEPQGMDNYKE